jgi:hypothetical protein
MLFSSPLTSPSFSERTATFGVGASSPMSAEKNTPPKTYSKDYQNEHIFYPPYIPRIAPEDGKTYSIQKKKTCPFYDPFLQNNRCNFPPRLLIIPSPITRSAMIVHRDDLKGWIEFANSMLDIIKHDDIDDVDVMEVMKRLWVIFDNYIKLATAAWTRFSKTRDHAYITFINGDRKTRELLCLITNSATPPFKFKNSYEQVYFQEDLLKLAIHLLRCISFIQDHKVVTK